MQIGSRRTAKFSLYYSLIVLFAGVCLIRPTRAFGQKENTNWIFGYGAGISFNTSPPSVISGAQLFTDEGCASVSDKNGNLLFYTDGRTVWNFNHSIMTNGTGLMAHISSTQAALITSKPGNCDQYYIFTTDGAENNFSNGLRYSVVDMSASNGLGQVIQKNTLLHTPVVEKLIAIPAIDSSYIWLLAHEWNSDAFLLFKISENNITLERKQNIGAIHTGGIGNVNGVGYAKVNASGTKIALINRSINSVELFDFNRNTGLLSNPIDLNPLFEKGYGIEFSPDDSKLYVGTDFNLYQYDLTVPTKNAILASEFLITSTFRTLRALQRAPDNKIYVAIRNQNFLGVINSPNLAGTDVSYNEQGLFVNPGISLFGLPTPSTVLSNSLNFNIGPDTTLCSTETLFIDLSHISGTYHWQDGSQNSSYTVSSSGNYYVTISNSCGEFTDSIRVDFTNLDSLSIPNIITPNNDDWNQYFEVDVRLSGSTIEIFNRWGKTVYFSSNYNNDWDGGNLASGVYYYTLVDQCLNQHKGLIHLIR